MINLDFSVLVTIVYILILYAFMNHFFFKPIMDVIHKRRELIEGRQELAQQRIAQVDQKANEYEQALKAARSEAYRTQEMLREKTLAERADLVGKAKSEAEKTVHDARTRLAAQAATAEKQLEGQVEVLARDLSTSLLRDKA